MDEEEASVLVREPKSFLGTLGSSFTDSAGPVCETCNVEKLWCTHHCGICNRCVVRMDHHCPWVLNCVGYYNMRFFTIFLFYNTFGHFWAVFRYISLSSVMEDYSYSFWIGQLCEIMGLGYFSATFFVAYATMSVLGWTVIEYGNEGRGKIDEQQSQVKIGYNGSLGGIRKG